MSSLKSRPFFYISAVLALCLSFTNFYSIGYLLLAVAAAPYVIRTRLLPTYVSKAIASLLLLLTITMTVGLILWFFKITVHPVFVVLVFSILTLFVSAKDKKGEVARTPLSSLRDFGALGIAIITPVLMFCSHFLPTYTDTAVYQILSNGWDNSSHVLMVETTALEKTYAYAPEKGKAYSNTAGAYPQAWHLATSNFANGFGGNLFNPDNPMRVLRWYLVVVTVWAIVAAFLLARITYSLTDRFTIKSKLPKIMTFILFVAANLIVQVLSISSAYDLGFANFVGLMTYMLLLAASYLDVPQKRTDGEVRAKIITGALFCSAAIMCWFLPLPALLLTYLLFSLQLTKEDGIKKFVKKHGVASIIIGASILVAGTVQLLIFVAYSGVSGTTQLNATGGVYKNSELLIALIVASVCIFTLHYLHKKDNQLIKQVVFTIAPMVGLIFALYFYQMVLAGSLSYYYYKLLYLLAIFAGIFFIPTIIGFSHVVYNKFERSDKLGVMTLLSVFGILGLMVIGTQQKAAPWHHLLQRNSTVAYDTAEVMTNYLRTENPGKVKLIALTDRSKQTGPKKNDIFNGDLVSRVTYQPPTCAFYVMNNPGSQKFTARVKRLSECADQTSDTIIVITNDVTKRAIVDLHKANIRIVNVK